MMRLTPQLVRSTPLAPATAAVSAVPAVTPLVRPLAARVVRARAEADPATLASDLEAYKASGDLRCPWRRRAPAAGAAVPGAGALPTLAFSGGAPSSRVADIAQFTPL